MTNGDYWLSDYVTDDCDGWDGRRYNVLAMIVNDGAHWCSRTNESNIESITPWVTVLSVYVQIHKLHYTIVIWQTEFCKLCTMKIFMYLNK